MKKYAAFSLIELSLILAVTASLAVGYMQWTTPPLSGDVEKTLQTQQTMHQISKVLAEFVLTNKRLPCPADPTVVEGTTNFAEENISTANAGIYECQNVVGSLPTRTLGITNDNLYDAWGRLFTYHVSNNLCGKDTDLASIPVGQDIFVGCGVRDYREGLDINDPQLEAKGNIHIKSAYNIPDNSALLREAAYVLVSHGKNGSGAYLPSGIKQSSTYDNEVENADGDKDYVVQIASTEFDDILLYRSKSQIENLNVDLTTPPVTLQECVDNSTQLAAVNSTSYGDLNATVTAMEVDDAGTPYNQGGDAVLNMMWLFQLSCDTLYTGNPGWAGIQCPGGATYNVVEEACECGDGTWDDSC